MATQIIKSAIVKEGEALESDFIYQLYGFKFDSKKLFDEYVQITDKFGIDRNSFCQQNLHVRSDAVRSGTTEKDLFFDFCGSLNQKKNHVRNVDESEFDTIHPAIAGTYTEEVIKTILEFSYLKVGRIRWLNLNPKTCYSMHKDPDWYRLHIPIDTHEKAFFIVDEKYFTMPEEGGLYVIHPRPYHLAANSDLFKTRLHLVFDTAKEES